MSDHLLKSACRVYNYHFTLLRRNLTELGASFCDDRVGIAEAAATQRCQVTILPATKRLNVQENVKLLGFLNGQSASAQRVRGARSVDLQADLTVSCVRAVWLCSGSVLTLFNG